MNILVVDIGGTHVKVPVTGETEPRKFDSGPKLTAHEMVAGVKKLADGWNYDVVSIGFPGPVLRNRPIAEPANLGEGWFGFNFRSAFGCPVKVVNDAAMQPLGSYRRGEMLFIGLGTGLGSTMIVDGIVEPMELGHLPYKKGTYESYLGNRALLKKGKKEWRRHVADVVVRLVAALEPDEVVLGGGNVKELKPLPPKCRAGGNRNAFRGGFRLWEASELAFLSGTQVPSNSSRGKGIGNGNSTSRTKLHATEREAAGTRKLKARQNRAPTTVQQTT